MSADYTVVVPTLGRPSLRDCLRSLAETSGPRPDSVVVVADLPDASPESQPELPALDGAGPLAGRVRLLRSGGRGPAAARNLGARWAETPWVVFLDDDVQVTEDWAERLAEDLAGAPSTVAGVQGRLLVPLPADRRPTDWERGTAGLEDAAWATADMAYRSPALAEVGGFDERFPRAFREDADLALRILDAGWELTRGKRRTRHPVRPSDPWASLRAQRGNADDALMVRLHGPNWWDRAEAPRGRLPRHSAIALCGLAAPVAAALGRRRTATGLAAAWALGTAEFAWARIAPGPRTAPEVAAMLATSLLIPPAATGHWLAGRWRHRRAEPWRGAR
ncbi:glycosyltransferase family 2 protein [Phaeacidiphilus oryzae]|uniref:glycosyltransferase family 2 protein n=1 Tax=Phaeacidiphilus oryzae TaxID=348818 RepID=UPI0005692D95|nr:glycosyltransferase [Phaeacidiphilus oryzae]